MNLRLILSIALINANIEHLCNRANINLPDYVINRLNMES